MRTAIKQTLTVLLAAATLGGAASARTDNGGYPYMTNISNKTVSNQNYRTAIWTGHHMQVTVMSIKPGHDVGLEMHPNTDQFFRIEAGHALVKMGPSKHNLNFTGHGDKEWAIFIPAGTWHNIINNGKTTLKVYSIYAPVMHPYGTVDPTKAAADAREAAHPDPTKSVH